jgi:hypothetical protein
MDVGPLAIGAAVANPKKVNLKASALMAADYDLTLPLNLPAVTQLLQLSNAGQASASGFGISSAPASNSFASSDSSGNITFPFKWIQVNGTLPSSSGTNILNLGQYVTFIGGFGTTTFDNNPNSMAVMNYPFSGTWHGCYISINNSGIGVSNNDLVNSNAFTVILFYI